MDVETVTTIVHVLQGISALVTAFALGAVWQHYRERR